jgi:hypothetical protein
MGVGSFFGLTVSPYLVLSGFAVCPPVIPKGSCSAPTKGMPREMANVARQASLIWFTANNFQIWQHFHEANGAVILCKAEQSAGAMPGR